MPPKPPSLCLFDHFWFYHQISFVWKNDAKFRQFFFLFSHVISLPRISVLFVIIEITVWERKASCFIRQWWSCARTETKGFDYPNPPCKILGRKFVNNLAIQKYVVLFYTELRRTDNVQDSNFWAPFQWRNRRRGHRQNDCSSNQDRDGLIGLPVQGSRISTKHIRFVLSVFTCAGSGLSPLDGSSSTGRFSTKILREISRDGNSAGRWSMKNFDVLEEITN